MCTIKNHPREYREYLIIIFVSKYEKWRYIVAVYIWRESPDKWFYVQQHSLLHCEHACLRYFTFCRVRRATSRNMPRGLTVGGRILCGSGNALRSNVKYHVCQMPCIGKNTKIRFYSQLIFIFLTSLSLLIYLLSTYIFFNHLNAKELNISLLWILRQINLTWIFP